MERNWPLVGRERVLEQIQASLASSAVVLSGGMGVGKSRLAAEVANRHQDFGWYVATVMGSASAQSIPFGPFAHLVPTLPTADLFMMLAKASTAVTRMGGDRPLLLVVEDAHYLDSGSRTLLERIIREASAEVLVTTRSTDGGAAFVADLIKADRATAFTVPPLTRSDTVDLLESIFDGSPDARLIESLWTLTEGNPLFVHEIVESAWSSGALVDDGTTVTIHSPLSPSMRLTELVRRRLSTLPREQRRILDSIAVIEPAPVDLISRPIDLEEVDRLVEVGLLRLQEVAGDETVQSVHPLYGEILRSSMVRARRKEIARTMAEALMDDGQLQSGSALQAAVWLLDADVEPEPPLALEAAQEALSRGDPALAERLGRLVLEDAESVEALTVVGTALSVRGEIGVAGEKLSRAVERAAGEELAAAALAFSRHLLWMEHRFNESMQLLDDVVERVPSTARPLIRVEQATQLAPQGEMTRALEAVTSVLDDPDANESAVLGALVWSTLIRVMLGRFSDLQDDLRRADQLSEKLRDDVPLVQDQIGANRVMQAVCVDLEEAKHLVVEGQERCVERGGALLIWTMCRAWVELARGDVDHALETTRRALHEAEVFDPFGNRAMAHSTRALALAHAGRWSEAERAVEVLDRDSMEPRTRVWFDRARYWLVAHIDRARERDSAVLSAVDDARNAGLRMWAAELAFDVVRLGEADTTRDVLAELARDVSDASMVPLYAQAAEAVVEKDSDAVMRVADRLLARDARLPAAQLTALAAVSEGGVKAGRLATRSLELLYACAGARPPLVAPLDTPLTERERQVARLAAGGASSRDIASVLFVSVRTVDNHLASVYRKLDLPGREGLTYWFPSAERRS